MTGMVGRYLAVRLAGRQRDRGRGKAVGIGTAQGREEWRSGWAVEAHQLLVSILNFKT